MKPSTHLLAATLVGVLTGDLMGVAPGAAHAAEPPVPQQQKDFVYVELSGMYDFHAVMDMLKVQLFEQSREELRQVLERTAAFFVEGS